MPTSGSRRIQGAYIHPRILPHLAHSQWISPLDTTLPFPLMTTSVHRALVVSPSISQNCFRAHCKIKRPLGEEPCTYLCGNSLGLLPKPAEALVQEELRVWGSR